MTVLKVLAYSESALNVKAGKEHRRKQSHTKAHTHLVCHLSELVNDGSYQIKTRQHIKTCGFTPNLPPLPPSLPVCPSVSRSSPVCLASIIPPIYSISQIHETKQNQQKAIKMSYLHK